MVFAFWLFVFDCRWAASFRTRTSKTASRAKPDARMKEILAVGTEVGMKMCHALRFGEKLRGTKYGPDRQRKNALNVPNVEFRRDSYTNQDAWIFLGDCHFMNTTLNDLTMAEADRMAALNGYS
jgi:hypothetical protein